jgi:cytoskeleton protein RodZ
MSQSYYGRHESAPGAMLAAAREELNLSVADVARHLKLSPAQVEALEEGAYDRLPGRVFVRGFLRNYAKLLGIDPQPLLRSIEHEMPAPVAVQEAPPSAEVVMPREQTARWPAYAAFGALVIVGLLAIYEFGFNEPSADAAKDSEGGGAAVSTGDATTSTPATPAPTATSPSGSAAATGSGTPAAGAAPTKSAATPAGATPPAAGTIPMGSPPPMTPSAAAPRGQGELVASGADAAKAAPAGARALHFKFDMESWVEIRDRNDKIIFSKLNKAGAEERVNGVPPLKVVVGNARGVHLNYDEKPVDLAPHIGVTVARLTLQ